MDFLFVWSSFLSLFWSCLEENQLVARYHMIFGGQKLQLNQNISFNQSRNGLLWFLLFNFTLYDLTEYTVSGREKLRIKVIWKWRMKMLCAGKVREAVSAWLEHFARVFFFFQFPKRYLIKIHRMFLHQWISRAFLTHLFNRFHFNTFHTSATVMPQEGTMTPFCPSAFREGTARPGW